MAYKGVVWCVMVCYMCLGATWGALACQHARTNRCYVSTRCRGVHIVYVLHCVIILSSLVVVFIVLLVCYCAYYC